MAKGTAPRWRECRRMAGCDNLFTLTPCAGHKPPLRSKCCNAILHSQRWWNGHIVRPGREPKDVPTKCWWAALVYPLFPLRPPSHQRLHSRGDWWLGRGDPCGVQGTIKVPLGTLPQRSPDVYSASIAATPIHEHASLRSKSSSRASR